MLRRLLAPALLAVLAACAASPEVRVDLDRNADFGRYRTFGWASPLGTDRSGYTTLTTERLKAAVQREMSARGYVLSERPDLLVNFQGRFAERLRFSPAPPLGYYGYRSYAAWPGYGWADRTFVDQYTEGTINIDLVDRARNALVWEGVAREPASEYDRAYPQEHIDRSVAAIFSRYPYRAGIGAPAR